MGSKFRMLVWEECRTGGLIAAVCLAIGVAILVALKTGLDTNLSTAWHYVMHNSVIATTAMPVALGLLLILNVGNSGHMAGGYSRRILRLPVPAWLTVGVTLGMRTLFVFTVAGVVRWVCFRLFGSGPAWGLVIVLTQAYLIFQLIDWLRAPVSGLTSAMILAGLGLFVAVTANGLDILRHPVAVFSQTAATGPGLFITLAAVYVVGLFVVRAARTGVRVGIPEIWEWPGYVRGSSAMPTAPFRSAVEAQMWYEHRKAVRFLVPVTLAAWLSAIIGLWISVNTGTALGFQVEAEFLPPPLPFLEIVPFAGLIGACLVCGLIGALKWSYGHLSCPYGYPVTTSDIVRSRLLSYGRVFFPLLATATGISVGASLERSDFGLLRMIADALRGGEIGWREVVWFVISWPLAVGLVAWPLLFVTTRGLRTLALAGIGIGVLAIACESIDAPPQYLWLLRVMAVGLVSGITLVCWGVLWGRRSVPWQKVVAAVGLWFLLGVVVLPTNPSGFGWSMIPSAIFLGALLPLSYASLFLDIEKQRHGTVLPGSASATDNPVSGGRAWKRYAGITLAVLFIVWLKWPTEATWKAVWRSRGLPTTAAELDAWYGTVPPERNLANIYLAVEKETSARDKAFWKEWEQYLPRDDTKFAYDHIKAWNWGGLRVGQRMDSVTWQWTNRYREAVVKPALTLLFEALDAGIEDTRWPVNYEADPWDPLGSIGSTARTLVWTLSKELVSCVIQDDADKAVQAANAMLRASACLRERPDELSFLVQAALVPAAIGGLEESLNRAEFSAGQLEKVKASLQKVRPGSLGKLLMPSRMGAIARIEFFAGPENILGVPPELVFARGLLGNGDLATGIMCHYCSTEFNCKGDSVGGCEAALDLESLRIVPGFWPNSYEALFGREVMARFDLACTAIAVEQYRLAHGTVPDSLDALVPEFLEQVPDDPLGPGPIRYVIREHGECVLYSVGPNFVDDGGTRAERYCEGDITFAVLPPAMRAQLREIVPVEEGQGG